MLCSGLSLAGLGLAALPLLGSAGAAPRIGNHEGYTRLVFDLPGKSTVSSSLSTGSRGNKVLTLNLQVPLKAEQGTLAEPGVASYAAEGKKVSLQLAAGIKSATASILPAGGGQPNRLVVDVPLAGARPSAPATVPKAVTPKSATPVIRPVSTAKPAPLTVVLDAGHGGIDGGMSSKWVVEKEVTLDVALRVRGYLQGQGVNVIMVRSTDTQLSVNKKADLLARSNLARADKVNAYIAIHVNSGSSSASGIETYYFGQAMSGANQSLAVRENGGGSVGEAITRQASTAAQGLVGDLLAQAKLAFSAQLARDIQNQLIAQTGADNRGVKSDALVVIKSPHSPAILTEIGFGSNPDEGAKLAQAAYRDKIANAISRGILKFLKVQ
jgi:N-acetylmuramoyl-L-alanine amidase